MQKQLQCTKIKDGLYLGNFKTAQDAQFLITNKFAYVINCSAEIPNFYEGQGIKYIKFKLVKDKNHKLWDEQLKKMNKLDKFIEASEETSMCCLIHSFDGANRGLVMLVAFLMNRYRWKLSKSLEFVRSKQIFIGLSEHYIEQLEILETILDKDLPQLSSTWRIEYLSKEEEILSKTFLNSQDIEMVEPILKVKKNKRVVWKDLLDKSKKKEQKQLLKQQHKERGIKIQENENMEIIDLTKIEGRAREQKRKKVSNSKKETNSLKRLKGNVKKSKPDISIKERDSQNSVNHPISGKGNSKKKEEPEDLDEEKLIKLIKKNLKSQKKIDNNFLNITDESEQKIYNVTINNFIKPNINIMNNPAVGEPEKRKSSKQQRPKSAWNKEKEKDKINRTLSEKEGVKPTLALGNNVKDRSLKNMAKKIMEESPRRKKMGVGSLHNNCN